MKKTRIETTIADILTWNFISERPIAQKFGDFSCFSDIATFDKNNFSPSAREQLTVRTYISSEATNGTSRDLLMLLYKGHPFVIYHLADGKAVENEKVFDVFVYLEFIEDIMRDYVNYLQKEQRYPTSSSPYALEIFQDSTQIDNAIYQKERFINGKGKNPSKEAKLPTVHIDVLVEVAISHCTRHKCRKKKTRQFIIDSLKKDGYDVKWSTLKNKPYSFVVDKYSYTLIFNSHNICTGYLGGVVDTECN
ncbi:hypothetical protein CN918_30230 [Priestia megaterium]|nr:hypothetical protein CN918_30230 [Priestia megaterium]